MIFSRFQTLQIRLFSYAVIFGMVEKKILFVSHDADDGAWQFLCGKEHNESDARIVSLKYVLDLDPTIVNLKDLPLGHCAERESKNDKWVIAKN